MSDQQKRVTIKRVLFAVFVVAIISAVIFNSAIPRGLSFHGHQMTPLQASARHERTPLVLFVGIFTAPRHLERRNAVRQTWGTQCKSLAGVVCWFITDGQDVSGKPLEAATKQDLDDENRLNDDMLFAESPGGMNFARRYLWTIQWAFQRYTFEYLLRADDDYFICLHKLLLELRHRPKRKLAWGWLHCTRNKVMIDEGFIIVTEDIIKSFLERSNSSLLCHPSGSQALAMWLRDVPGLQTFADNERIFHRQKKYLKMTSNKMGETCGSVLAIHQTTPPKMRSFWNAYVLEDIRHHSYELPPIAFQCKFPHVYDYKVSTGIWFAVPKLCKDMPTWNRGEYFKGRQGGNFTWHS